MRPLVHLCGPTANFDVKAIREVVGHIRKDRLLFVGGGNDARANRRIHQCSDIGSAARRIPLVQHDLLAREERADLPVELGPLSTVVGSQAKFLVQLVDEVGLAARDHHGLPVHHGPEKVAVIKPRG